VRNAAPHLARTCAPPHTRVPVSFRDGLRELAPHSGHTAIVLQRFRTAGGWVGYRSTFLDELGVPHAFTTRVGGLDVGPLADEGLAECLRGIVGLPPGARWATARQVHGAGVVEAEAADPRELPAADALVSSRADRPLLVRTADCVPVLVARADGARVAAVHAGWRGLAAGVIPAALAVLGPGAFVAAIGPCLCSEHFEVGPEVADAFRAAELASVVSERPGRRPHVDLARAAAIQLARLGVERIDAGPPCTWEGVAEFYSYRRDVTHGGARRTGRLAALIAPRPAPDVR